MTPSTTPSSTGSTGAFGCVFGSCSYFSRYPPTKNAAACRKLKVSALLARLQLLSAFFEPMGYYGMLVAIEGTVHANLMWFGGRAAKHASGANDGSKSPAQEALGVLFKRHRRRYHQVIAHALDPFEVDSSGYRFIPELLEKCQAIDPTRHKNLRLSNTALAHIIMDVSGSNLPKELRRQPQPWPVEETFLRPFSPLNSSRSRRAADCRQSQNGEFTALKPSPPVKYQPPSSPNKHLAYYLGISSDEEDQEQEEGNPGNDHDEDKEKAQEDTNQDAHDQDDEEDDEAAAENPTSTDNGAASDAGDKSSKPSKPSSTSPDSQTPK
ncbi:hypothetical protein GN958_ATG21063 [Phytophthora infestans]|uniref:Uncharacterized protein n=1 Tax=Phytophthora infestans TaxID=4787 RepID=A0A8S9TT76_PHYIN|nr:hypothetical protein GN958_ATG21063 [Phytophthora infestans]